MNVRHDRIARVQARMRDEGLVAIVIVNHDDYRYLFGEDRVQPRAIIPVEGPPTIIAFAGEEPEIRAALGEPGGRPPGGDVLVFGSVGGQIHEVVGLLRELVAGVGLPESGRPKVGMQMWFETPAFLVELFRKVNPGIEVVSSDPVMDPLRMVKDDGELAAMAEAQRVAGIGMDRARDLLRPGVTAHEIATEATYTLMRAGAERTSTPIYVTFGIETCMLHGRLSPSPLQLGELAVIDLTPQVEGYCANLARTFVVGEPDVRQRGLLDAYAELIPAVRDAMRPGVTVGDLDGVVAAVLERRGLAGQHVNGIGHGLGLRFEETPASTIIPPHRNVPLRDGMVMTIGHTVLALPGFGGVRHEDAYRVTPSGGVPLHPYPIDPVVPASPPAARRGRGPRRGPPPILPVMSTGPATRRARLRGIFLDVEPLRRDRDYRLLWTGQLISGMGRQVTVVALPFQLYVLTQSTLAVGLLALVQLVPILVFALGGGAVADAVDRRRLLLVTQLGLAGASSVLFVLAINPGAPIWGYYAVAAVAAGLGAVDQPARTSAIPRLVPIERLPSAIALNQLGFQAMAVAGPAMGGILLATVGVPAAFFFDAVTFGAAIVALLLIAPIPPHAGAARPSLTTVKEGIRFVRRRRVVLSTFVIDLVAMVFGMPTSLYPALALTVFGVGPAGVGLLAAAPAAGALLGATLSGWVGGVAHPGRAVIVAVAAWGLAITAFGLTTFSFALALVFLAIAGAADVFSAVLRSSIVQLDTPDHLRGRVASIHILVVTSGPRLGDAEAAAVAALTSPQFSVVSGGILCLLGLVAVVQRFPELRRYTYPASRAPEPLP